MHQLNTDSTERDVDIIGHCAEEPKGTSLGTDRTVTEHCVIRPGGACEVLRMLPVPYCCV